MPGFPYFKPHPTERFAGDCMPFFHDGVFHLYYLLDEGHHTALGGLGGHQWAHASSPDLIHWTHHPLAIAITEDGEGSICTGSTFYHKGTYYGFYATRWRDRTQHLSLATSADGVHFTKTQPNPLGSPLPGYDPYHYRDPFVFRDDQTGQFHMLVTARLNDYALPSLGGCLAHLVSPDLEHWDVQSPFLVPGLWGEPECSDHFFWNGWYYLLFSNSLVTRYRMSRQPLGPWLRPAADILDAPLSRVMKTAPFTDNRRIGVAWLGTRENDRDNGRFQWGGHTLFRELVQREDGTLGTRFVPEMLSEDGTTLTLTMTPLTPEVTGDAGRLHLTSQESIAVAQLTPVPGRARITMQIQPGAGVGAFGLKLRGSGAFESGYDLHFSPHERAVRLFDTTITTVDSLDRPFTLDLILNDDIIDVDIDHRRCIINRCPERQGDRLFLYVQNGRVAFDTIVARQL